MFGNGSVVLCFLCCVSRCDCCIDGGFGYDGMMDEFVVIDGGNVDDIFIGYGVMFE